MKPRLFRYTKFYTTDGEKIKVTNKSFQQAIYKTDIEIKVLLYKFLQKLEDILREKIKKVIGDDFLNPEIFQAKYREKRINFIRKKLAFLKQKGIKHLNAKNFFNNLSFGELVYYFNDLKKNYKEEFNKRTFNFLKVNILTDWLKNMNFLRNLICHNENILNREFEENIGSNFANWYLKNNFKFKTNKNNTFWHYLAIVETFDKSLNLNSNISQKIIKILLNKKKATCRFDHHVPEIFIPDTEGWQVFLNSLYSKYVRNQEKVRKVENKKEKLSVNVKILRYLDQYLFGFLNYLFFWLKFIPFNKSKYLKQPKKILIIRLWALGSSILTFPMIKQLKDHLGPNIQLDLLATNRNQIVFKNQGYFNKIYNLFSWKDLLKLFFSFKKYDVVIDTEEYFRTTTLLSCWLGKVSIGFAEILSRKLCYNYPIKYEGKHQVIEYLKLLQPLGIKYKIPEKLEPLIYTEKDKLKVDEFLKQFEGKIKICMHTAGAETAPDRFWPIQNWKNLIERTIDKYGKNIVIFLSGTKFEENQVNQLIKMLNKKYRKQVVSLVNKFNLFEFTYFLEKIDLMISNDTGPMHLAAAMGTKTIGLFGPNLPERFGAWPLDKNINLYKGNGKVYIKVMEGVFEEDKEKNIEKIKVENVLDNIVYKN